MKHTIDVKPFEDCWVVVENHSPASGPIASGAAAEWAARRLGEARADSGEWAEIRIYLRDGTLAGCFLCPPTSKDRTDTDGLRT